MDTSHILLISEESLEIECTRYRGGTPRSDWTLAGSSASEVNENGVPAVQSTVTVPVEGGRGLDATHLALRQEEWALGEGCPIASGMSGNKRHFSAHNKFLLPGLHCVLDSKHLSWKHNYTTQSTYVWLQLMHSKKDLFFLCEQTKQVLSRSHMIAYGSIRMKFVGFVTTLYYLFLSHYYVNCQLAILYYSLMLPCCWWKHCSVAVE